MKKHKRLRNPFTNNMGNITEHTSIPWIVFSPFGDHITGVSAVFNLVDYVEILRLNYWLLPDYGATIQSLMNRIVGR